VYTNKDFAQLYNDFVTKGRVSIEEALIIGARIEELDIYDLKTYGEVTDNADINLVYDNLMRGSRNHLRAFVSQIEARGGTFEPKYISKEVYEDIVSSDREQGVRGKMR